MTHLAAEICGLSPGVVERVLTLDRRLEGFPKLRRLFERNQVGWTKLEVIMSQVTPESEERWARLVCSATRSALMKIVESEKQQREDERSGRQHEGELSGRQDGEQHGSRFEGERSDLMSTTQPTPGTDHHRPAETESNGDPNSRQGNGATAGTNAATEGVQAKSGAQTKTGAQAKPYQPDLPDVLREWISRGPGTGRQAIYVPFDLIEVERMFVEAETLGRGRPGRRPLSPTQVARHFMDHHSPEADSRPRYTEVIYHDPVSDEWTLRTTCGKFTLTEEDMARRVREGEPVDLVALHEVAKEAAVTYVTKRAKAGKAVGRYLPAPVRRYLRLRYHGFCATPGCHRHATHDHHLRRHALDATPDPDAIVPLCHHHGTLAHLRALAGELPPVASRNQTCPTTRQASVATEPSQTPPTTRQVSVATGQNLAQIIETGETRPAASITVTGPGLPPHPDLRVVLPQLPETPEELARARIDAKVQEHRRRAILHRGSLGPAVESTATAAKDTAQVSETPTSGTGTADSGTETTDTGTETAEADTETAEADTGTADTGTETAEADTGSADFLAGEVLRMDATDYAPPDEGCIAGKVPCESTMEGCALETGTRDLRTSPTFPFAGEVNQASEPGTSAPSADGPALTGGSALADKLYPGSEPALPSEPLPADGPDLTAQLKGRL